MSHQGTRILYHLINRRADALAERAFAPMPDMAQAHCGMRHLPSTPSRPTAPSPISTSSGSPCSPSSTTSTFPTCSISPASRAGRRTDARTTRSSSAAVRAPPTRSRWLISSTPSSSATARRRSTTSSTPSATGGPKAITASEILQPARRRSAACTCRPSIVGTSPIDRRRQRGRPIDERRPSR